MGTLLQDIQLFISFAHTQNINKFYLVEESNTAGLSYVIRAFNRHLRNFYKTGYFRLGGQPISPTMLCLAPFFVNYSLATIVKMPS